jgi:LemA protein
VAVVIVLVAVSLVLFFVWASYNGIVSLKNKVDNGWAQIDVQLKRRHDLIPNLVETVKGYAAHESGTLEAVVQARNSAMSANGPAEQAASENVLTGALKSIFALSEAYPDLKANQNFLNLQEELTGTEGRIAYARQFFNDAVTQFNTKIQKFPANILAKRFGFTRHEYFELDDPGDRSTVQVDFGTGGAAATPPATPPAAPTA